ncbi:MAG: tRNA preQ1(34) S-adenosylmethionine ribosyltransferase-isomerase QueA [Fibrobacterota bacterium]
MRTSDFDYNLPEELIAQYPEQQRDNSRLLVLNKEKGGLTHSKFSSLPEFLKKDDLLITNNTKVIPARLTGRKETGGQTEIFLLRNLEKNLWEAIGKPGKYLKKGNRIIINDKLEVVVTEDGLPEGKKIVRVYGDPATAGPSGVPLPHYIKRKPCKNDVERYQTVYASKPGAVAAPTAGLHFTNSLFTRLRDMGVQTAEVTLHVSLGTFRPVKSEDIASHKVDAEYYEITAETAEKINSARGRKICVGTTSLKTVETAARSSGPGNLLQKSSGFSDLFIYPPFDFKITEGLITNFHLPRSTLIMLVSAFAGRENIQKAYREAVAEKYRFFSYGDAMLMI